MNNYENYHYCPVCDGNNNIEIKDFMENIVMEVETKCTKCGHKDYWAFGLYESAEYYKIT